MGAQSNLIENGQNAKLNVPWTERPTFLAPRMSGTALARPKGIPFVIKKKAITVFYFNFH
jgi:hypothetical protein